MGIVASPVYQKEKVIKNNKKKKQLKKTIPDWESNPQAPALQADILTS